MVALVQAGVIWLLWSTAQGATLKSTRGSASGMAAHATALVHERESFEARSHAQLAHWWKTYIFLDFWVYFLIFCLILRFLVLFLSFFALSLAF